MTKTIAYIPGVLAEAFGHDALPQILKTAGADLKWEAVPWTSVHADPTAHPVLTESDAILMAYQAPSPGGPPTIVTLREQFKCFANVRPLCGVPGLNARFDDIDLLVVRESTEDIYAQLEHESIPGVYESLKVTTRGACEKIARFAFETTQRQKRKKVTIVHKANIMKKSDGLFLAIAREVGAEYPDIEVDDCIVDALCMKLILHPEWFDVLLCGNLFGDIVSDLGAGLVGGRANCPSANIGPHSSIFTTGHLSETPNDSSLVFSCILMLRFLGQEGPANRLMSASRAALINPREGLVTDIHRALA